MDLSRAELDRAQRSALVVAFFVLLLVLATVHCAAFPAGDGLRSLLATVSQALAILCVALLFQDTLHIGLARWPSGRLCRSKVG